MPRWATDELIACAHRTARAGPSNKARKPRLMTGNVSRLVDLSQRLCNLVITPTEELEQAKTVAKRIDHDCKTPPILGLGFRLEGSPCRLRALNCCIEVLDDEIQMDW